MKLLFDFEKYVRKSFNKYNCTILFAVAYIYIYKATCSKTDSPNLNHKVQSLFFPPKFIQDLLSILFLKFVVY